MPRKPRFKSDIGIYHIIVRGINRQVIFQEEEDYKRYIETHIKIKEQSNTKILAYCLMSNHVHLMIKEGNENIGEYMKRIGISYVSWFNKKYNRVGHLFQDRYKSQAIQDESYLLTVFSYIHQNPIKAGIVKKIANYRYSSWHDLCNKSSEIIDIDEIQKITENLDNLKKFIQQPIEEKNEEQITEVWKNNKKNDYEVSNIIRTMINKSPIELQNYPIKERNKIIKKLRDDPEISIRQIERITGIGRGVIYRVK